MQIFIYTGKKIKQCFLELLHTRKEQEVMRILTCIRLVRDNYNGNPTPPLAKPLSGQGDIGLNEFRISFKNDLVRIHYFIDREKNVIVILNYYTKANGARDKNAYNKKEIKQLKAYISEQIEIAKELQENYFSNPHQYELLN